MASKKDYLETLKLSVSLAKIGYPDTVEKELEPVTASGLYGPIVIKKIMDMAYFNGVERCLDYARTGPTTTANLIALIVANLDEAMEYAVKLDIDIKPQVKEIAERIQASHASDKYKLL
jgi:hypothetical protein